jgi:unsaturated chondroitin disaccharide hydrolase
LSSFIGPQSLFIDIMMNVPIIFYAARETGDAQLQRVAEAHCRTTRDTLVRADGSTAHEGIFDTDTGQFLRQSTPPSLTSVGPIIRRRASIRTPNWRWVGLGLH